MNILSINGTPLTGIYVDAAVSFNKPAKRVSTFSVPGRNGDLVIDEGTFDNVLISYPVYEKTTFPQEFDSIVNWLASLEGYQKIQCSNDPQHYRLGRFVVPVSPTAKRLNKDGYYTLSFDCKPQRWLLSGDEDTEITQNPIDEYSGALISFNAVALDEITELKANITAVQSGSGDPSPDNIRLITGWSAANVYRAGVNLWDEEWEVGAISDTTGNNTSSTTRARSKNHIPCLPNTTYYFYKSDTPNIRLFYYNANKGFINASSAGSANVLITTPADCYYIRFIGVQSSLDGVNISINYPSTDHNYHAYVGQTYPISLGQTVYGGTLNVTTGVLTIDRAMVDLGTLTWTYSSGYFTFSKSTISAKTGGVYGVICSAYPYATTGADKTIYETNSYYRIYDSSYTDAATFKTAMTGVQLVYPLATPTEVQLTPTEVELLLGQNNIWADTGDVEVKVTTPTIFNNPSPFNSKPLIRVYGTGDFKVNDITVTITAHDKPYIDIDCEAQECYYEGENMASYVTFSGNDFPELVPGNNYMLLASGITKLDVTPRWWIL